jgi:hypothetical protein
VASSGGDVTLRPKKPSIAGREDAVMAEREQQQRREVATERVGREQAAAGITPMENDVPGPDAETLKEPRVYRVEERPETPSQSREPAEPASGPRYLNFQQRLRQNRDRVVSNCPLCGSQEKVA